MQMHNMGLSITLFVLNCHGWRVRMVIKYQQEAKTRTLETFEARPKYFFCPMYNTILRLISSRRSGILHIFKKTLKDTKDSFSCEIYYGINIQHKLLTEPDN